MATDANNPNQAGVPSSEPKEEFISIADIARMILKHRVKIAVFVMLVTIASAVVFLLSPRQYKAEGFLQVIPPASAIDEKVDQASFETIINSHLQTLQSAYIASEVATAVSTGAIKFTSFTMSQKVKITRPPKSNLIVLVAGMSSPDQAVNVVKTWIEKYFASMRKNNVNVALSQVRSVLKKSQSGLREIQAKADQLKARAEQTSPLVDLSRGIDNSQLWRELAASAPAEKLKDLSRIHVNDQEQSGEYLTLKTMLCNADLVLASTVANCDFLHDTERYLEYKVRQMEDVHAGQPPQVSSNVLQFTETMLKITDVIEIGAPSVKSSSRGALRKTAIAFFASLVAASFCACLYEWYKTVKI